MKNSQVDLLIVNMFIVGSFCAKSIFATFGMLFLSSLWYMLYLKDNRLENYEIYQQSKLLKQLEEKKWKKK